MQEFGEEHPFQRKPPQNLIATTKTTGKQNSHALWVNLKAFRVCSNTKTSLIAQIHELVHTGTARAVSEPAAALLQLLMLKTHPQCSTAQHSAKEGDAAASSATWISA